jgi:hypothetical protein
MNDLPAEAYGEAWLSLSNEQRTELLSQRRDNQLRERALEAPANQDEDERSHQPEATQPPSCSSGSSHQSKE